jgi:DNA-binding response OmpR family regulator
LRKQPSYDRIPVIIVTAKELSADDIRDLREMSADIITKDHDYLDEMISVMRHCLNSSPSDNAQ